MRSSFAALLLASTSIFALVAPVAKADSLIQNGGFETTTLTTSKQFGSTFGGQTVTGWTGSGYDFLYMPGQADTVGGLSQFGGNAVLWGPNSGSNNGLIGSPDGGNFVALDGGFENSQISQTLNNLIVGDLVTVSFSYAGAQQEGWTGATQEWFDVTLGSQTDSTAVLSNASEGFTGWNTANLTFTATSTSETLTFFARGTPQGYPPFDLLDGVSATQVAPTPEPSSLALLGTGVACAAGVLRRRLVRA